MGQGCAALMSQKIKDKTRAHKDEVNHAGNAYSNKNLFIVRSP